MKSKLLVSALLSVLVGCLVAALSFSSLLERFELGVLNYWFLFRGKIEAPNDIVMVAMDELSYRDLNVPLNQAWPRKIHAQLLERLAELGAKRVIFDVLFLDAGSDPAADTALEKAIHKVPVYLGVESATQHVAAGGGSFAIEELLEPYAPFAKAAAGFGLVSLPEENGVVRRFLTQRSEQTAEYASLAEAGAGFAPGDGKPRPKERDLINYLGPGRTLRTLSYYQILETEHPIQPALIKDKIVFVGLALRTDTGPAQKDVYETSYGGLKIFGAEIHATAAANLMSGNWITRLSVGTEVAAQVIAAIVLSLLIMNLGPTIGGAVVLCALLGWSLISFLAFRGGVFLPGMMLVAVILPALYLVTTLYFYFVVRRSAQQMKSAFELYLSPDMVQQLSQGNSGAGLGGTKLWATALFTDIESFTQITEEMPAERVAEMLNAYFTEVMDVIFHNKGTLIKFIGDAVFVLWGAPIKADDHAALAIKTGLALSREVERFNSAGRFPALRTRIGINTGPMVVGNLGSKKRFDYTAIGDSVNLASRVEGLNKYFGSTLLFTEATRKDAGAAVVAIKMGDVQVVGKKETISLFTTFDPAPSPAVAETMNSALDAFRKRKWSEALSLLEQAELREPRIAHLCKFYRPLIESYIKTPPPQGWSGELEFSHK